jgi:diguanylate cyclase (GGDEF)-like protein
MNRFRNENSAREAATLSPEARFLKYSRLDLLRNVDFNAIDHLFDACEEISCAAGEVIITRGEHNDSLYQVLDGQVEVRLQNNEDSATIALQPGACVGELSILSGVNASAHVVAGTACEILVIPANIVWSFTNSSHEFARNLLNILAGRVRDDNRRLIASLDAKEHYKRVSRVDALTGLFNRTWFDDVLERHCQRAQRKNVALSTIFIDIDRFKIINDEHGHLIGDLALRKIAGRLQQGIRSIDSAARFGGEEFALLLYGINLTEAREIAERLRRDIEQTPIISEDIFINVTFSAGVAQLMADETPQDFITAADKAMYRAKNSGRNQVAVRQ